MNWSHLDGDRLAVHPPALPDPRNPHDLDWAFCLSPPNTVCRCYESSDEEIWSVHNASNATGGGRPKLFALGER